MLMLLLVLMASYADADVVGANADAGADVDAGAVVILMPLRPRNGFQQICPHSDSDGWIRLTVRSAGLRF